jgi:hypothetical protein
MQVWLGSSKGMELGNKGVTMHVWDPDGAFRGKLRLGRGTIEWSRKIQDWCAGVLG